VWSRALYCICPSAVTHVVYTIANTCCRHCIGFHWGVIFSHPIQLQLAKMPDMYRKARKTCPRFPQGKCSGFTSRAKNVQMCLVCASTVVNVTLPCDALKAISLIAGGSEIKVYRRVYVSLMFVLTGWQQCDEVETTCLQLSATYSLTEGNKWCYGDWYKHNCGRKS